MDQTRSAKLKVIVIGFSYSITSGKSVNSLWIEENRAELKFQTSVEFQFQMSWVVGIRGSGELRARGCHQYCKERGSRGKLPFLPFYQPKNVCVIFHRQMYLCCNGQSSLPTNFIFTESSA